MIYLYALYKTDLFPFPQISGLGGVTLQPCLLGDITLAVGEVANAPSHSFSALCEHEAAVEALAAMRPILPFRFGTVVADLHPVAVAAKSRLTAILANLDRVSGCVELGLSARLAAPEAERQDQRDRSAAAETGRAYLEWLRREAEARSAGAQQLQAAVADLDRRLLELSRCRRRLPSDRPDRLWRTAYLVPWNAMPTFQVEVAAAERAVARETAGRLSLLASGPWPPYSFVKEDLLTLQQELQSA